MTNLTRRRLLTLLGSGALAAGLAACRGDSGPGRNSGPSAGATGDAPAPADCVLSPEQTEGPYYIDGEAVRYDITEGKEGTPLRLAFRVVDAGTCQPLSDALVDIWHADAGGVYSGFGAGASNRTFLRGVQATDAGGAAGFRTIYPGWYQGRATHIHVKVHVGGQEIHTGQLYFDEAANDAVYRTAPYRSPTGKRTTNATDRIYRNGGAASTLRLGPDGDGQLGTITLGVEA